MNTTNANLSLDPLGRNYRRCRTMRVLRLVKFILITSSHFNPQETNWIFWTSRWRLSIRFYKKRSQNSDRTVLSLLVARHSVPFVDLVASLFVAGRSSPPPWCLESKSFLWSIQRNYSKTGHGERI